MLYIKRIKAENLFSWLLLNVKFSRTGAYSFNGENGVGKSSIFEIISWVFFKKTTKKNVKGNYGKDDGYGQITLSDGKTLYKIKRDTKTPAAVFLNGKMISQEDLENLLGGNYSVFMASNMCSQKRVAAFVNEASDSGKAKIFGEMLGCGIVDKIRSKVQTKKNDYQLQYETLVAKVDSAKEHLQEAELVLDECEEIDDDELKELEEQIQDLKAKQEEALQNNSAWDVYDENVKIIKEQEETLNKREIQLHRLENEMDRYDEGDVQEEYDTAAEKFQKYANKVIELTADNRNSQSRITELKDIMAMQGSCPTCGSKITDEHKEHVQEEIDNLKNSMSEKLKEIEKNSKRKNKVAVSRDSLRESLDAIRELKTKRSICKKLIKEVSENIKQLKANLRKPSSPRTDVRAITEQANIKAARRGKLLESIETRERAVQALKRASRRLKEASLGLSKKEKLYNTYLWLFKNLPLMKLRYINDNKMALEDIINENIASMSIPFIVKIDTQKQLKSTKEIKEAFSFQIINTARKKERKADKKDLSGGEETCILLATQFGISDVAGTDLDFEIYDEVYGSLDGKNKASIVDALKARAEKKQVFTISHDPEIANSFTNSIYVERKDGYSRISG